MHDSKPEYHCFIFPIQEPTPRPFHLVQAAFLRKSVETERLVDLWPIRRAVDSGISGSGGSFSDPPVRIIQTGWSMAPTGTIASPRRPRGPLRIAGRHAFWKEISEAVWEWPEKRLTAHDLGVG